MNMGIIIGSLGWGGAERVAVCLCEEWVALGHSVCFFTVKPRPDREYALPPGVKRYDCRGNGKLFTIQKLRKALAQSSPDVVLVMDTPVCVYAVPALAGLGIPFVVSERSAPNTPAIKRSTKLLAHGLMRRASGFVFQTEGAKAYYSPSIQRRSVVIGNPLKRERIPAPYEGRRDRRVVAVGRLIPAKNYPLLLSAFVAFHADHPDYQLEIYGGGPLEGTLLAQIRELGAEAYIRLMGPRERVLEEIVQAGQYVLCSDLEGMPNALIEAMAMGLPCISTDCPPGGPRELIESGVNGLLVPPGDRHALTAAMTRLAEDPALARRLSQEAVKQGEKLDSRRIARQWIRFFEQWAE